jgi:hypothetical protein
MTVLSASSVSTYEECHLQWYFTYVEMRDEPPNEPRETGIALHDYAEWVLKTAISDSTVDDSRREGLPEALVPLADIFKNEVLPTYGNPTLIEAAFELDVEGIAYTGFIDSVDVREVTPSPEVDWDSEGRDLIDPFPLFDQTVLRDLKSTNKRPAKGRYRDALIGYWQGARELGHEADLITLDYIVRTKKPYYWPEHQAPPDDDELDLWVAKVEMVAENIEHRDFEPTGVGTYVCNYCPFKDICGPYERYQDITSPLRKE